MAEQNGTKDQAVPAGELQPGAGALRPAIVSWQTALLLVVWILVVGLHWNNDGLWYTGDSSRHAANGMFWKSYLGSPTLEVKDYALSYYARYPVINPIAYPPFFYFVEAAAYTVFGPSAFVAKNLVLAFLLIATLYVSAWLHRWVSPHVAWAAVLLLLMPGIVRWSHAIMLNVPALALSVASIYHGRRWAESVGWSARSTHLHLSVILCFLTVLTYYPAGAVVFALIAVISAGGAWKLLARWQTLLLAFSGSLLLVPIYFLLARWNPGQLHWLIFYSWKRMWKAKSWLYYLDHLPGVFGWPTLALATLGLAIGLSSRRWRREILVVSAWLVVTYAVFSIVMFKDVRYILTLGPPLACLCAIGLAWMTERLRTVFVKRSAFTTVCATAISGLLILHGSVASTVEVPVVKGFTELAAFFNEVSPDKPVFYDGAAYNGVFTFQVLAHDPDRKRRVVLGNKLLYSYSMRPGARQTEYVSSPGEVVELLRSKGGCRWIAIERGERGEMTPGMRYLRQAVDGPEFELVRSFPIIGKHAERVDVYRLSGPISRQKKIRLPFPNVTKGTVYEVEPIAPRTPPGAS